MLVIMYQHMHNGEHGCEAYNLKRCNYLGLQLIWFITLFMNDYEFDLKTPNFTFY